MTLMYKAHSNHTFAISISNKIVSKLSTKYYRVTKKGIFSNGLKLNVIYYSSVEEFENLIEPMLWRKITS